MINPYTKSLLTITVLTMLSACASTSSKWQKDAENKIAAELENTRQTSSLNNEAVNNSLSSALMPPLKMDLPQQSNSSPVERFNVTVNKGKAQDVYINLVKGTKYSVVLDPSIEGKISLKLKNVTLDDAFNFIENAYGFHYEKSDTHYIIYGKKITTKIYNVDYLDIDRGGSSGTSASSGGLLEGSKSGVKIETSSKVNFWRSLKEQLETIIGKEDGRGVTVNGQSGIIIARGLPGELRMIENYLDQIQSSITRQVILEAKLLEIDLDSGYQTGINWGQLFTRGSTSLNLNQVGGGTSLSGANTTGIAGGRTDSIVSNGINGGIASAFGGVFSMALQTSNFGAFIELISTQGKVHVLSSPRIATINNQKAVIKVGGEEYYITGIESGTTSNTGGAETKTSPSVTLTPFFSGIALDVTPQIDKDGNIMLHLHPTVSDVNQRSKSFTIDGKGFDLPLA
ncbi:MAG: secretin N-terminal domain-containing protein, partial [Gammaproteobacteria bacterium]|nr:secretin N-terminal domain-containing protein [Gammaproteobacteria bacterium]